MWAAIAGVVVAVAVFGLVLAMSGSGDVEVRLGDDTFDAGRADRMAVVVERDGPILYPDLLSRDRPIYLAHTGDEPTRGWRAFIAVAPGQAADCILAWDPDDAVLEDPCSDAVYGPEDEALIAYPTAVVDGRVVIDLRIPAANTTTTPTTISPLRTGDGAEPSGD